MTATTATRPALQRGLIAATSLGFLVVQLDVSVVNLAIKPIGAEFGGGISALQWVVNAYTITFAALILTSGALGDRIGARRVFVAGFALFTLASMACGVAPGLGVLIGARAIQGVGAAILVPCSLTLLRHAHHDPADRARAIGLWAAGASLGLSGGPVIGGLLIAALGWRAIFFINVPIGVLGIALTLRHARETTRTPRAIDLPGQLTAIAALALLAGSVIEGGAHGFGHWPVLVGCGLALACTVAFVAIERARREPMLPLRFFALPAFRSATIIGVLLNVAVYGLLFALSLFFQRAQHLSPLQAGLAFAPMTAVVMGANILAGHVSTPGAAGRLVATGAVLLGVGSFALLGAGAGTPYSAIVVQLVAIGFGVGLIVPVITTSLLGAVDADRAGVAAGTLNTARQTGSMLGVAIFGALVASGIVAGLHVSLVVCGAIALGVLALAPRL